MAAHQLKPKLSGHLAIVSSGPLASHETNQVPNVWPQVQNLPCCILLAHRAANAPWLRERATATRFSKSSPAVLLGSRAKSQPPMPCALGRPCCLCTHCRSTNLHQPDNGPGLSILHAPGSSSAWPQDLERHSHLFPGACTARARQIQERATGPVPHRLARPDTSFLIVKLRSAPAACSLAPALLVRSNTTKGKATCA